MTYLIILLMLVGVSIGLVIGLVFRKTKEGDAEALKAENELLKEKIAKSREGLEVLSEESNWSEDGKTWVKNVGQPPHLARYCIYMLRGS